MNGKRHVRSVVARVGPSVVLASLLFHLPLTAFATSSITLQWFPSLQPEVVGYRIYYGTSSRNYEQSIPVSQPNATIPGLVEGKTYYFAVSSLSGLGEESMPSPEIAYVVPPLPSGNYEGLFSEPEGIRLNSAGAFSVSVTSRGSYSGRVRLDGRVCSFSGKLGENYRATNLIQRAGASPLTLEMALGAGSQLDRVSGSISGGTWTSELQGDRARFNARQYPAPYTGDYTVAVPGGQGSPSIPNGNSFGTMKVSVTGAGQLTGSLADGSKISRSAPVSRYGRWPLYIPLYSNKGLAMGWFEFVNLDDRDLGGSMTWIKPADPRAKFYAAGFSRVSEAIGSAFLGPVINGDQILNFSDGLMAFLGGNLGDGFTEDVLLGPKGIQGGGGQNFTVKLSPSKGTFSGKVGDPASGKTWTFSGVVLQKGNAGYGFLVGSNQTSEVVLMPAP